MNISKTLICILSVSLFLSSTVFARFQDNWSKEQKEVWNTVMEFTEVSAKRDFDKYLSYFHPDFVGWYSEHDKPTNKKERAEALKGYFQSTKTEKYVLTPSGIKIHGNIAIVHYVVREDLFIEGQGTIKNVEKWIDVLKKERGRWLLISDHGGPDKKEENQQEMTAEEKLKSLSWLEGEWEGRGIWAYYSSPSGGLIISVSKTLRNGKVVAYEHEQFHVLNGDVYVTPYPNGRKSEHSFKLTGYDPNIKKAVFVNEEHDWPTEISYERVSANELKAIAAGPGSDGKRSELVYNYNKKK